MKNSCHTALVVLAILLLTALSDSGQCATGQKTDRFFWMGSGKLHLNNLRNNKEARVELLNPDGSLNDSAFTEVDRVFGFPTSEKEEHISPRLLFMLSYFSDLVAPGRMIAIESAYRSPDYNDKIRKRGANAARTSTHMDGMALDFRIDGVNGKELWQTVRQKNCCGVGHYGGQSIHLDAGRPRFWESATSGTKATEPDYNRHIYLSTDYDRYRPGDAVRLSLSGISTFGFGIRPAIRVYPVAEKASILTEAPIRKENTSDCFVLSDRKASRFINTTIPADVPAGRYRIELNFCQRPFAQMPESRYSNEIEVIAPTDERISGGFGVSPTLSGD